MLLKKAANPSNFSHASQIRLQDSSGSAVFTLMGQTNSWLTPALYSDSVSGFSLFFVFEVERHISSLKVTSCVKTTLITQRSALLFPFFVAAELEFFFFCPPC